MRQIDINCDMGEGVGNEALLMPYISSANIACGYHAGGEDEMKKMVALCLKHEVAIGAHPSFRDSENFGRKEMNLSAGQISEMIQEQLNDLNKIIVEGGGKLHHIKPHGALYNMAVKDTALAMCLAKAVKAFDSGLIYYGLSGSVMIDEAVKSGLQIAREAFADRTYQPDGSLTPRTDKGALVTDIAYAIKQVMQMINAQMVTAADGKNVSIAADTICIHGDAPTAVSFAREVSYSLRSAGVRVKKIEKRKG